MLMESKIIIFLLILIKPINLKITDTEVMEKFLTRNISFKTPIDNNLLKEQIKDISFSNTEVRTSFSSKKFI